MAKKSSNPSTSGSKPVANSTNGSRGSVNHSSGRTLNKVTFEGPTLPPTASKTNNKK